MQNSGFRRTISYLVYMALVWVVLDGIVAFSGFLVPEERVRWFSEFYMPDSVLGFRIRPRLEDFQLSWMKGDVRGTYSTDTLGFRNVGRDYNTARYFFIGDSFTFGAWVARKHTFYGLLEQALGEPMITYGVGGYGLAQYNYILHRYCADSPSGARIFLCIFANDLESMPDSEYLQNYYSRSGWQPFTRHATWVQRLAPSRTATWHLMRRAARILFGYGDYAAAPDSTILYERRGTSSSYLTDKLYLSTEAALEQIFSFCRARDLKITILLFPSKEAIYEDDYARLFDDRDYLKIEQEGYDRIEALATRQGIPVICLTGLFRRHKSERLFFMYDPHCNERSHQLVADTLLSWITASDLGGR